MMFLVAENLKQYSGGVASGGNFTKLMLSYVIRGDPNTDFLNPYFLMKGRVGH